MGIEIIDGRWRSVRRPEERRAIASQKVAALSPLERTALDRYLTEWRLTGGDTPLIKTAAEVEWEEQPVPVREWLMNIDLAGETGADMYPQLREDLVELFEGDYSEAIMCLHPDTRIPLLDGSDATISELAQRWAVSPEPFWVYSIQDEKVVPALAQEPRQTGVDDYLRVTLDDGSSFTGNSRHQMIMRDGSKRMIRDLLLGDSLMPFETRVTKGPKGLVGYEQVMDPASQQWVFTHRLVARDSCEKPSVDATTVHHKNFKKRDNCPQNLAWMRARDHRRMHGAHIRKLNLRGQAVKAGRCSWSCRSDVARAKATAALADRNRRCRRSRTDVSVAAISEARDGGAVTMKAVARVLNCSPNCVRLALRASGLEPRDLFGEVRGRPTRVRREASGGSCATPPVRMLRAPDPTAEPEATRSISLADIEAAIAAGSTTLDAATARLGCSRGTIGLVLRAAGLSWWDLKGCRSPNHFVTAIERVGHGPVFCMTVPRTTNFAIITSTDGKEVPARSRCSGVFSSNTGSIGYG